MSESTLVAIDKGGKKWSNWARTVECTVEGILYPKSEKEVLEIIKTAKANNKRIRVVGAGHSFSPLVETSFYIVSLQKMSGLISVNKEAKTALVWAGTVIKDLGELLFEHGLGQLNLGDIDMQSVAGATATGTHGTGINYGSLSTQIIGFRLATAGGELIDCSRTENPDLFDAGRVALGTLGIITQVELQLRDAYKLEYSSNKGDLNETLENLEQLNTENRNFEFYWMPYTNIVQHRCSNETDLPVKDGKIKKFISQRLMENVFFGAVCKLGVWFPKSFKRISRLIGSAVGSESKVNYSHRVYATVRNVKFREMEYNIPVEHFKEVLKKVTKLVEERNYRVYFPIECRFVKGDDIWLSPAYGRDSAYLAVHVYHQTPHDPYFEELEQLFMDYDGRPHWGKMHKRSAADLKPSFERWDDFMAIRAKLDPDGLFLNGHLEEVFGV